MTTAEVLPNHRLRLAFDDGAGTKADFADDLWGRLAEPLRDLPASLASALTPM